MTAESVLALVKSFRVVTTRFWLAGGWAVDALIGKQTRPHDDVDIAFDASDESKIIDNFRMQGFEIVDDARPTRFVLKKGGIQIDLHPVVFGDDGVGRQLVPGGAPFVYPKDAFGDGSINGTSVPNLTAKQLLEFHLGYTPLEKDRHNVEILCKYLRIDLPYSYKRSQ